MAIPKIGALFVRKALSRICDRKGRVKKSTLVLSDAELSLQRMKKKTFLLKKNHS
jgi:hypothetical protein